MNETIDLEIEKLKKLFYKYNHGKLHNETWSEEAIKNKANVTLIEEVFDAWLSKETYAEFDVWLAKKLHELKSKYLNQEGKEWKR